ncbi:STAM-binding protein-like A [Haliotis rufescens]|uniref:STAM-binding protein-like A n=1 Tax=Haliotis rufescens TaxID=6454 RepID=UPI001EB088F8|nr:STAM-binding protein-like A [Haliotis rufescens]XP_046378925.1 STAM-binding protein-like A [Haliotis rufescens]
MAVQMFTHIHEPAARVRALCDYGSKVDVDKAISPKLYLRSGREMIRMANIYLDEGNLESAFILYSKYITLFIEKLPRHPDYKSAPHTELAELKRKLKHVFPLAEEIKSKLKTRYTAQERERQAVERKRQEALEQEAQLRREEEERVQQEQAAIKALKAKEADDKWRREQEERYRELQSRAQQDQDRQQPRVAAATVPVFDPELDPQFGLNDISSPGLPPTAPPSAVLPAPPSYDQITGPSSVPGIPDRELKKLAISDNEPTNPPSVDRSTKPSVMTFDHFTSIGGGGGAGGLREITVPTDLMKKFLDIAQSNTDKKTETLGILFGTLAQDQFHVTHLFIPQQRGTPDSCDMENEIDLIDYQDKYNLINLGWIHTHPTQTAFLSSVDLHSHYPYQIMLPEAIAIVCSPKYNETGIFRLTNDRGIAEIGGCSQPGFHYHTKEPPLFESSPHVKILEDKEVTVADMRKK